MTLFRLRVGPNCRSVCLDVVRLPGVTPYKKDNSLVSHKLSVQSTLVSKGYCAIYMSEGGYSTRNVALLVLKATTTARADSTTLDDEEDTTLN